MLEIVFLVVLALIWILFASIQDLRKREVANWVSFSLIIFALGFRFFYSLFNHSDGFSFFYQGLIGLGIFFIIGNLLYYGRMFAGGDAKLMISLGTILPFSMDFFINIKIFVTFLLLFLFSGAVYGTLWSLHLSFRNFKQFKKELKRNFIKNKKIFYLLTVIGIIFVAIGFLETFLFLIGIFVFVFPYVFIYARSVDEACMIKNLKPKELTEGDWLYRDLSFGRGKKKVIKATWDGLSKQDIKIIQKHFRGKKVKIREGIPFVPVFFIGFLMLVYFWFFSGFGFLGFF